MLGKERKLTYSAYVVIVEEIMIGEDEKEYAIVNNKTILVHEGAFKRGDPAIYFELNIQNQNALSQGVLFSAEDFGWTKYYNGTNPEEDEHDSLGIIDDEYRVHFADDSSRYLTEEIYITPEQNNNYNDFKEKLDKPKFLQYNKKNKQTKEKRNKIKQ